VKSNGKIAFPRRREKADGSIEPDTAKLARRIAAYAPHDGSFDLRIPGLCASRYSRIDSQCAHILRQDTLGVTA
jgi:hypothetical protein